MNVEGKNQIHIGIKIFSQENEHEIMNNYYNLESTEIKRFHLHILQQQYFREELRNPLLYYKE